MLLLKLELALNTRLDDLDYIKKLINELHNKYRIDFEFEFKIYEKYLNKHTKSIIFLYYPISLGIIIKRYLTNDHEIYKYIKNVIK
jgi:hypothetical protein